jgi:NADPH2:quinone reductase
MRAAVLTDYGPVENFEVTDVPAPTPGSGELLVDVAFAGVRYGDVMARHGIPRRFHTPPFVAGQELAGTVAAIGDGVERFAVGDRVAANVLSGAYAEQATVPAAQARRVPDGVGLDQVLTYLVNLPVAYLLVHHWAQVRDGDAVLIHAAAGGVGSLAIKIIRRDVPGARIIAMASNDRKLAHCRAAGAHDTVNYKASDYVEQVLGLTDQEGVDVSMNSVSGTTLETDPKAIRTRGRWVIYGMAGGIAPIHHAAFGYRGITIKPMSILAFAGTPELAEAQRFTDGWMATETLDVPTRYTLDDIVAAQTAIEDGTNIGKSVIEI